MPPDGVPGEPRGVWVQLLETINGLADGTREWRNCFLAAARGLGFETSVLEPCVLVLRNTQQNTMASLGLAVDDIAGGGDELLRWCRRQMDPCVLPPWETEKGTIRKCQRDRCWELSGTLPVKADPICQDLYQSCRVVLTRLKVSDIPETNRVVRLAKAHTDLALPVCKIPLDRICLVSYGDASGGNARAERAQAGYVIMFADRALLEGMAAPATRVSCRSHRVKRVVTSASAAEAMGLSEAIAQGDWVRALWSEVVLGLNLREWREQGNVPLLISVTDSKDNYKHFHNEKVGTSEGRRGAIDLAIIREDQSRPQTFLRWVYGKAQVADALTKLHGDGDLLRAVCRQAFTVLVEAPEVMAARRQEKRERKGYRESCHHQSCGSLWTKRRCL